MTDSQDALIKLNNNLNSLDYAAERIFLRKAGGGATYEVKRK